MARVGRLQILDTANFYSYNVLFKMVFNITIFLVEQPEAVQLVVGVLLVVGGIPILAYLWFHQWVKLLQWLVQVEVKVTGHHLGVMLVCYLVVVVAL